MMLKFKKPRNIGLRFGVTQLPGVAGAQLVPAAVLVLAGAPPSVAAAGVYPSYMPPRQPIFLFLHQPRSWMPVSRLAGKALPGKRKASFCRSAVMELVVLS